MKWSEVGAWLFQNDVDVWRLCRAVAGLERTRGNPAKPASWTGLPPQPSLPHGARGIIGKASGVPKTSLGFADAPIQATHFPDHVEPLIERWLGQAAQYVEA